MEPKTINLNRKLIEIEQRIHKSLNLINKFEYKFEYDTSIAITVMTTNKLLYDENDDKIYKINTNLLTIESSKLLLKNSNVKLQTQKFPSLIINFHNPKLNFSIFPPKVNTPLKKESKYTYYYIYLICKYLYNQGIPNIMYNIHLSNSLKKYRLPYKLNLDKIRKESNFQKDDVIKFAKFYFKHKEFRYPVTFFPSGAYNICGLTLKMLEYLDEVNEKIIKKTLNWKETNSDEIMFNKNQKEEIIY